MPRLPWPGWIWVGFVLVLAGLTPAGATSQPGMLPVEQVSVNGFFS